jgi:hypothetical protein
MSDWLPHCADPINGSSMTISKDELVEIRRADCPEAVDKEPRALPKNSACSPVA